MRIYMDVCCYNRPLDNLAIDRNRLEAEAVLSILAHVQNDDKYSGDGGYGNKSDSFAGKKAARIHSRAASIICRSQFPTTHCQARQLSLGLAPFDALHVACTEIEKCDAFLTADDRLVRSLQML